MKKGPKQILPYLPYNVKYAYRSPFDEKFNYEKILSLDDPEAIQLLLIHSDFFLVLRPLSDLTKEIEVDGEKLTPLIELASNRLDNELELCKDQPETHWGRLYFVWKGEYKMEIQYHNFEFQLRNIADTFNWFSNQYELHQKLISWHFDISNLIEKGHAIDINTL